ncbi:MAG: alpha/beta hydrolase family protein [Candidatus Limnocylindria bacterium]
MIRTGTLQDYFDPASEAALTEQTVVDVQRAFDVLSARPDVDPARLGFIGHSWGASLGAVVAARDPRPAASVLITGRPSWTGFLLEAADRFAGSRALVGEDGWQAYLDAMAPYDAVASVGEVDADRLYLQFGTADDVVIASHVEQWLAAIQPGVKVDTYAGAGHALDAAAVADRARWLADALGLGPIADEALEAVGLPDRPTRIP